MPLPRSKDAREFYRSAWLRLDDATILFDQERTIGTVYLAGYAVECMLKALVLEAAPPPKRKAVRDSFRGARAHDFDWLRGLYRTFGGPPIPPEVARRFAAVGRWTTELRYRSKSVKIADAEKFLRAVEGILEWADGRLGP